MKPTTPLIQGKSGLQSSKLPCNVHDSVPKSTKKPDVRGRRVESEENRFRIYRSKESVPGVSRARQGLCRMGRSQLHGEQSGSVRRDQDSSWLRHSQPQLDHTHISASQSVQPPRPIPRMTPPGSAEAAVKRRPPCPTVWASFLTSGMGRLRTRRNGAKSSCRPFPARR